MSHSTAPPFGKPAALSGMPSGSGSPAIAQQSPTLRRPGSIYDRSVFRRRGEVSLAAFAYLFSETIQYAHKHSKGIADLEERLSKLGYRVGLRVFELVALREGKSVKRETKLLGVLQYINTTVWRALFGRQADSMQVSNDDASQYMIIDHSPLVSEFVSVPRDLSQLNCAAFVAGIIEAVLNSSLFNAKVSAHTMETAQYPYRTVYLVRFESSAMARK